MENSIIKKENQLQIFNNEKFGQVRTVLINEEPWFVGKDMVECLGYEINDKTTYRKYVDKFCDKEDITEVNKNSHPKWSAVIDYKELGQRGGYLVNESGMYSLIFGSDLPQAKEFKKWITSEVLPTLRKTGYYSLHNEEESKLEQKAIELFDELNEKTGKLGEYFRPKHKTKLALNKFIKDCLGDNATKENCNKAKDMFIMILGNGEYTIYEDIPLEKIKNTNTMATLYDICKNINNSIVGGVQ